MRLLYLLPVLFILLFSCKKKDEKHVDLISSDTTQTKILILCEGNYLWGNASLDLYYPKTGVIQNDIYKKQNNNKPLGDVLQSGLVCNGSVWLVINNSGKVVAVDRNKYTWQKAITGLKSPRYMSQCGKNYWITDIYNNAISLVDTHSLTLVKTIHCKGWTEQIATIGSYLYVANANGCLYRFDGTKEALADSVLIPSGSKWMCRDKNSKLWVLSSDSSKSFLSRINPVNMQLEKQFAFPKGFSVSRLEISKNADSLFFLEDGVFTMDISDANLPSTPVFRQAGGNYYGLGVDPYSGLVYVADAKDYVSKGICIVISSTGKELHRFTTGITPSSFLFYR